MVDVSVIIPAYNEERRIAKTLLQVRSFLRKQPWASEIIVVDNNSTDRTAAIVREFQDVRLILEPRQGKGAAVRAGMLAAQGALRLFSDADLSTPIAELPKFVQSASQADVIIGSRAIAGADIRVRQPRARQFLGKTLSVLVQGLLGLNVKDTQCGFKMFSKDAAEKIFSRQRTDGFLFDVELLHIARKHGFAIRELPVVWRNSADTKVRWHDPLLMFGDILRIRLNELRRAYR